MGQLEGGFGVDFENDGATLSLPSREKNDLAGFTKLVLEALSDAQSNTHYTPCPFSIAENLAAEFEFTFGDRERLEIVRALVNEAEQRADCDYRLDILCGLVHQLKVVGTITKDDSLRDNLLVTLSKNSRIETAQILANQLVSINTDFRNLPELLTVLPDNFSQEAWDRIGETLGLGPTKNPSQFAEKIRTAYESLTGADNKAVKRSDIGRSNEVFLSDGDAKEVIFRVLSLPIEKFEREGISQRWNKTELVLREIEKLTSQWEQGITRTEKIIDSSKIDLRKNAIKGVAGFQSLNEETKSEILSFTNFVGSGIAFKVKELRIKFEHGYKEEELVLEKLRNSGTNLPRDIYRSNPGSISDQFGRDIAIGKRPNTYESYVYVDIKSSQQGVQNQIDENVIISGKKNLPGSLQAIPVNDGPNSYRIYLRAVPVCFRVNGDTTRDIIDNPLQLIFEAERTAKRNLEEFLKPRHSPKP
jgi:hypothetical protein